MAVELASNKASGGFAKGEATRHTGLEEESCARANKLRLVTPETRYTKLEAAACSWAPLHRP